MTDITPRSELLPSYMSNILWQDFADAIDEVFSESVDPFFDGLKYVREAWPGDMDYDPYSEDNSDLSVKIQSRVMLTPTDFDEYEINTNRQRLNQIGLHVQNPAVLNADAVNRLVQNTGMFWYYKGLGSFIDYMSFIFNTPVGFINLWTQDYVNFYAEGDPTIGTPKWQGGTWYPTTHIDLDLSALSLTTSGVQSMIALFYDISNYNLVLRNVIVGSYMEMVPDSEYTNEDYDTGTPVDPANIVGLAVVVDRIDTLVST